MPDPTDAQVQEFFRTLSNWGRWGPDDELGTMNLVTPEKVREAARLVSSGETVSCALPISRMQNVPGLMLPVMHFMIESGDGWDSGRKQTLFPPGMQGAADWFGMVFHGSGITHIDSPAHIFHGGKLYNGWPSESVSTHYGATKEGIDLLHNGIVSRGVLLDIPAVTGRAYLDDTEPIRRADLEAAERAQGVLVRPGDVAFVRTGTARRRSEGHETHAGQTPGLHADALPWLRERDVAVLGSDSVNDVGPSGYDLIMPIHQVGIVGLGLWLIDNAALEPLAEACGRHARTEFLVSVGPLRLSNATGSPINPIAIF